MTYRVVIRCLDEFAGFARVSNPNWVITVPFEGGRIGDLLNIPLDAGWVWETPDGSIPGLAKVGDLLLDTSTSDLFRIRKAA